jgi:hypothetical protein
VGTGGGGWQLDLEPWEPVQLEQEPSEPVQLELGRQLEWEPWASVQIEQEPWELVQLEPAVGTGAVGTGEVGTGADGTRSVGTGVVWEPSEPGDLRAGRLNQEWGNWAVGTGGLVLELWEPVQLEPAGG